MLKSNDVVLGPLRASDMETLFGWINDRQLVLYNSPFRPVHPSAQDEWFESIQKRTDLVIFAIRLVENDRLIGSCQLTNIHAIHRSAELQIRIGDAEGRGKGYGKQALQLLLKFGFHDLNLHRVWLHVYEDNQRAVGLYKKLGFKEEGCLRDAAYADGRYKSIYAMSMLKDEYDRCNSSA